MKFYLRKFKKKISIKEINNLSYLKNKKKIKKDIKKLNPKKKNLKFKVFNSQILMGVLNLTPDSFSDGGKLIKKNLGVKHAKKFLNDGCRYFRYWWRSYKSRIKTVNSKNEWKRDFKIL